MRPPNAATAYLPPIQRCATCGGEWIIHHSCPNAPRSTSTPTITGSITVTENPYARSRALSALNEARRRVMDLHGGNLDHPALDLIEQAMAAVENEPQP